tara:strand:+ start:579 stop:857 length:279 start_codon:yes stop_codon:yes gene_type:complete
MTEKEAYNHGYNGTIKMEELLAQFPAQPHNYEEPPQLDAWRSGAQDRRYDEQDDFSDSINEDAVRADMMTDGEADADALASAGYGTDEDYGF